MPGVPPPFFLATSLPHPQTLERRGEERKDAASGRVGVSLSDEWKCVVAFASMARERGQGQDSRPAAFLGLESETRWSQWQAL